MTSAKTLFLRKEPGKQSLAEWWVTVCHDERFRMVHALALAHAAKSQWPHERLMGASELLDLLETISDNEVPFESYPSPGLVHQMPTKDIAKPKT